MEHSLPPRSCSVDIEGVGNSVQFTLKASYLQGAVPGARDRDKCHSTAALREFRTERETKMPTNNCQGVS